MNHLSLFSGIGGFDLAAQWMGWENIAHCEINPFCRRILSYYWPEAASHSDIKTTDFSIYNGTVDIISGGFPCQPYSTAGLRKGKEDSRHLWPEMLRAIREISPRWVVGENVRGLTNWNGGVVFDEVQADLEAEGYEVLPFLLPACAVNAPHRRDRIWFVAHSGSERFREEGTNISRSEKWDSGTSGEWLASDTAGFFRGKGIESEINDSGRWIDSKHKQEGKEIRRDVRPTRKHKPVTDTNQQYGDISGFRASKASQFQKTEVFGSDDTNTISARRGQLNTPGLAARPGYGDRICNAEPRSWQDFPTQPPVCGGDDGLSGRLDFDAVFEEVKNPRNPAKAYGRWRNKSIEAYGNAVVPGLVYQIFKSIEHYETETLHQMRH